MRSRPGLPAGLTMPPGHRTTAPPAALTRQADRWRALIVRAETRGQRDRAERWMLARLRIQRRVSDLLTLAGG